MAQLTRHNSPTLPRPVTAPGSPQSTFIPTQLRSPPSTPPSSPIVSDQQKKSAPWKYEGYQAFSKWMASDDDFFVFRRFESLNANTILWMQYQISQLEKELEDLHKEVEDSKIDDGLRNDSFHWDAQYWQRRNQIMGELSRQLLHYNQFIDSFSKVRSRPRAQKRQVENVRNWLNLHKAIDDGETEFSKKASDLISINSRSLAPLGQWLTACRNLHTWKIFRAKELPDLHINSVATIYSSSQKFDTLTTVVIMAMGLVMLLAPMWWLEYASDGDTRLKIITGFLCVFICLMSTATVNRPFEVVAATAAYAAVLMVFMQIDEKGTK